MDNPPPRGQSSRMTEMITVVLITYGHTPERTEYAIRTIRSVEKYLQYPRWQWYISDDGSQGPHLQTVLDEVKLSKSPLLGFHSDRISYGGGANRGINAAIQSGSSLMIMLEDDWELNRPLDMYKYAALLLERRDIGMVRMGYLNDELSGTLIGHSGSLYWLLDDSRSRNYSRFSFAGHPSLIHSGFFEVYGMYPERWQPGDTELRMCWQVSGGCGPKIAWPAELGERGPWDAIGAIQSYNWLGGRQLELGE